MEFYRLNKSDVLSTFNSMIFTNAQDILLTFDEFVGVTIKICWRSSSFSYGIWLLIYEFLRLPLMFRCRTSPDDVLLLLFYEFNYCKLCFVVFYEFLREILRVWMMVCCLLRVFTRVFTSADVLLSFYDFFRELLRLPMMLHCCFRMLTS